MFLCTHELYKHVSIHVYIHLAWCCFPVHTCTRCWVYVFPITDCQRGCTIHFILFIYWSSRLLFDKLLIVSFTMLTVTVTVKVTVTVMDPVTVTLILFRPPSKLEMTPADSTPYVSCRRLPCWLLRLRQWGYLLKEVRRRAEDAAGGHGYHTCFAGRTSKAEMLLGTVRVCCLQTFLAMPQSRHGIRPLWQLGKPVSSQAMRACSWVFFVLYST